MLQLPPDAPHLLPGLWDSISTPAGFPFRFPGGSETGGQEGRQGSACHVTQAHPSQGMVGCTGSNPGTYYSDIASVPHNRTLGLLLNLLKHFGGFITDEIKCDSVKICGVINSTDKSSGLLAVTFM